ncbi:uncharacterized protein V6R79_022747, partial [Siganus canaliculatus]
TACEHRPTQCKMSIRSNSRTLVLITDWNSGARQHYLAPLRLSTTHFAICS